MRNSSFRLHTARGRLLLLTLLTCPGLAPAQFVLPNTTNIPGAVTNALGSTTIVNQGLVAIGHISASSVDSFGETFGSISSMQVTGWTNNPDGSYSGTLNILPDRGYNSGNFFADYAARINQVSFSFRPYTGSTGIGGATDLEMLDAQTNQLTFGAISGVKFTYDDPITGSNSFTTGLDPGSGYTNLFGQILPYVISYTGFPTPSSSANATYNDIDKLPLDAEALNIKADGSGYIGDEYGANIYYFDSTKKIIGAIVPPAAFRPYSPATVPFYNSLVAPGSGRRNNQGFEGVSLSPDGTRLFALLQSATIQDSNSSQQNRRQTRLLIYDVSTNPTNSTPLAEYALTLPTYQTAGNGSAVNATCAQSEVLALDNHRFLVLSRDGNGLGNLSLNPNVYKSIILVDTSVGSPTDFAANVARNAEAGKITTSPGVLDPSITPLQWVEVVNLLNTNQLAKFNVRYDTGSGQVSKLTMGEKWEGLALVPARDLSRPDDYFLFVGNDNDFLTSAGQMRGPDGTNVTYNAFNGYPVNRIPAPLDSANNESDTRILVYRVTIRNAFTTGNLVAERTGDGGATLSSVGTPVFVDEYTTNGSFVQSKPMPRATGRPAGDPFNLMDSGSATSNGQLTRSADGRFILLPGYNGTNGDTGIAASVAVGTNRVIGVIGAAGTVDTSMGLNILSSNNFRSVTSVDGTGFWAVGAGGLVYVQPGAFTNALITGNLRCVRIFNGQLFISSGSGTPGIGVHSVGSGLPTNGTPATTQLIVVGGGSPSPYNFEFSPAMSVAYVADDRSTIAGGIIKYTNNGAAWVSNYTLATMVGANVGARGLAVDWSGPSPVIYATTSESSTNRIVKIVDAGLGSAAVTLATSPTNTAFRGLAFAPIPLQRPSIVGSSLQGNGSFEVRFTGQATQPYRLLATTNIVDPSTNWTILTSGAFGSATVTNTDTAAPGLPQRFYKVTSP